MSNPSELVPSVRGQHVFFKVTATDLAAAMFEIPPGFAVLGVRRLPFRLQPPAADPARPRRAAPPVYLRRFKQYRVVKPNLSSSSSRGQEPVLEEVRPHTKLPVWEVGAHQYLVKCMAPRVP